MLTIATGTVSTVNVGQAADTEYRALAELREWIESNPNDPFVDEARRRYNECVELLQRADETFYDYEREIDSLERT